MFLRGHNKSDFNNLKADNAMAYHTALMNILPPKNNSQFFFQGNGSAADTRHYLPMVVGEITRLAESTD